MKTNFDPFAAQKAKRDLAERLLLVGHKYLPEGWTHEYRKGLSGCCWSERKHIAAPRPVTRKSLYIWLHECAHAHLHSDGKRRYRVNKEYEAEQWAHRVMKEEGIAVPRKMTKRAKAYVQRQIERGEARGQKRIDPNVRKFAGADGMVKAAGISKAQKKLKNIKVLVSIAVEEDTNPATLEWHIEDALSFVDLIKQLENIEIEA